MGSGELSVLSFEQPEREWAVFVVNNRNARFRRIGDRLCNRDNKYDIVYGPVADDDISVLLQLFVLDLIDVDTLARGLSYKYLSTQYSFHTQEGLARLKAGEE